MGRMEIDHNNIECKIIAIFLMVGIELLLTEICELLLVPKENENKNLTLRKMYICLLSQ